MKRDSIQITMKNISSSSLKLGSFSFEGLESPDQIVLRTKQRLAIHYLGSGSSLIDSLGQDATIVSFRGIFSGTQAATRIRAIQYLRSQGQPIPLIWGSTTSSVVIRELELTYSSIQWVSYKLSCCVVGGLEPGVGPPLNVALRSPEMQVSEVLSLLQDTSMGLTSDQASALAQLAALNYDIAPPDAVQQIQGLLDTIDSLLATTDRALSNHSNGTPGFSPGSALWFVETVADMGQRAALLLSYNRIAGILVCAACISQQ
jgi:hypothetical protein